MPSSGRSYGRVGYGLGDRGSGEGSDRGQLWASPADTGRDGSPRIVLPALCLHNDGMSQLTIRDVPQPVKDALASAARSHGQSLQAYVLDVLHRQADFVWNADLLVEIEGHLHDAGGVEDDAPSAAKVVAKVRDEREGPRGRTGVDR